MNRYLFFGSRGWTDRMRIALALESLPPGSVVVHGAARGADSIAAYLAKSKGIAVDACPVDHAIDGPWPAAGHRRNRRMFATKGPFAGAFGFRCRGKSNGTDGMREILERGGVPVVMVEE